jgi:hypothetical protein
MLCHLRGGTDELTQPKMYLIECQESCFREPEIPFRGHTPSEQQDFEPFERWIKNEMLPWMLLICMIAKRAW